MAGRIFFLGEGKRDVGEEADGHRVVGCPFEGDVPRAVRRLAESFGLEPRFGYQAATFRHVVLQQGARAGGRPMRRGGKAKELRDAILFVLETNPRGIVAVLDGRLDELSRLQRDAEDVLLQYRERNANVPVAIGIAVQEIEAWMLADIESRRAAFALTGEDALWDHKPEALADPKHTWHSYAGRCDTPAGVSAEVHADLQRASAWTSLRVEVVAMACPLGFAPFVKSAHAVLTSALGRR